MSAAAWSPQVGDSVNTTDGPGIVLHLQGTPSGNAALVFLLSGAARGRSAPPVYGLADLEPGPPFPALSPADYVTVPGGHAGTVLTVDGDEVLCTYELSRPRLVKRGWFPRWRLLVATLSGR
jgi:hypothetical protein